MLEVDREQVLAHRIAAHGLHRDETDPNTLAVFDLGLQNTQRDTAALSLAARVADEVTEESMVDDPRFVLAWTHRGAPHFHRRDELPAVTSALVPLDETDAMNRMLFQRRMVEAAGVGALDGLFATARAIREVVHEPMTKGAVSTAITKIIPSGLSAWCRGCQATHVSEQVMRLAAVHGGTRLEAGASPATLAPLEGSPPMRTEPDPAAATAVVVAYLRLHGPATPTEAAGFVGTTATMAKRIWPDGLTEVRVDGRKAFLPTGDVPALENPPEPGVVRLLPPWDPFLQARDRGLLVPDKARQKEIWKIIGNPGALLVHGEVAGTWRTKAAGRKRLDFTVHPFWTLRPAVKREVEAEAERVAAVRGVPELRVAWTG
ncbi:winged helix DNA-binding domain-containing protein [Amycolatopsis taiwanensis]|uniref:winged helix DNA-binding domain-containing protein n=1 Tax=Amycolatopsis taiwanensis TaxID=342230 RepID=UPI000485B938|nr:winged helix DNA-binding domain-containing protein [Amycolatopsis taiwanensis]